MFRKRTPTERFWEILPGLQFWTVFLGTIILSYYQPLWAAFFIICFDLYWVLKACNVATHLMASYWKFRLFVTIDWQNALEKLGSLPSYQKFLAEQLAKSTGYQAKHFYSQEIKRIVQVQNRAQHNTDFRHYYHLVLIPFVDESIEVLDSTLTSLKQTAYPKDRMIVVLASEERAGQEAQVAAEATRQKFSQDFYQFVVTKHPDGLAGEIKGKSANASYAVQQTLPLLKSWGIAIDQVIVSNLDSDTIVHPQYFARVTYEFLLAENPYQCSYQPIAIYNNNIWDSPAIIRVVSVSNSFWQFTESSRPDRLRTFSSHSMTLKALVDVGFWKKDIINEDGFIFWQCYLHYQGNYQVVPLFIPISLDTCLAPTLWETLKNQYKQKRRWAYNVEYYPHLIGPLLRLKTSRYEKLYKLYQYIEGNFNWATASIMISTLGWLPLFIGGREFQQSVIAFNLPTVTKTLMNIALFFLIFSVYVNMVLLPPKPANYSFTKSLTMYLQWFLVPIASVIFGSIPAVEAQTRLMFGQYLEFWVTPKARKGENTGVFANEMKPVKQHI